MVDKIKMDVDRLLLVSKKKKKLNFTKYINKFVFIIKAKSSLSMFFFVFSDISQILETKILCIPRKHFGDSWRQYLPIAIEGLWGIIGIICVRIFVRFFLKSFDNNTALKRLSINGHFLWPQKSWHQQVNRWSINEHIYLGDFSSESHQFVGNIEERLRRKI